MDLQFDEIQSSHGFCDRMLDLDSRIHFEEIEVALRIDEKLAGPRPLVADRLRRTNGRLSHHSTLPIRHPESRRFFDELLMPPLNRTFSFAEMNDVSMAVSEDLDFDVARTGQEFLEVDCVVAEGGLRFARRAFERGLEFGFILDSTHPAPATARTGLDQNRISKLDGHFASCSDTSDQFAARNDGHTGRPHPFPRSNLLAHRANDVGWGANESDTHRCDRFRELRVLRKKPVSGMNRVGTNPFRDLDDPRRIEITLRRSRRSPPSERQAADTLESLEPQSRLDWQSGSCRTSSLSREIFRTGPRCETASRLTRRLAVYV